CDREEEIDGAIAAGRRRMPGHRAGHRDGGATPGSRPRVRPGPLTRTPGMDEPRTPFGLPLIAILRGVMPMEIAEHVEVLVDEGFDAIEIPTNSPDWARSVAIAVAGFGDRASIGAGTVLEAAHVD